jgi:NADH-quinone oxidoreductase subunit E
VSRLSDHNVLVAREIISRYPKEKSALIPLVHLSQEQNGLVTNEAMRHIAELIDVTPAEVYGTASFYEMFRFEPTGRYLINICGTMSCALMGADDLMHHAETTLGIKAGSTTDDGMFTLQHAECQAACT